MQLTDLKQVLWNAGTVVFDTETDTPIRASGPSWVRDNVVSIGFAWGPAYEQSAFLPATTPGLAAFLTDMLGPNGPGMVVAHNAKFDLHMVRKTFGVRPGRRIGDTLVMAHLLDENEPKALKTRAMKEFGDPSLGAQEAAKDEYIKVHSRKRDGHLKNYGQIPSEIMEPYCRTDCNLGWRLHEHFEPQIKRSGLHNLYATELDLLLLLVKMEEVGVLVDREFLAEQEIAMTAELKTLTARVARACGHEINLGSDAQLRQLLYEELKLPVPKWTSGGKSGDKKGSTDEESLKILIAKGEHVELLRDIKQFGTVDKQRTSYVQSGLEWSQWDGRIHADFFSCGTRTGRFSCSKPNLQNVTRPDEDNPTSLVARRAFICDPGPTPDAPRKQMTLFDYDQIEMRGFAHYTADPNLCKAYHEKRDVYSEIASWIHGGKPEDYPKGTQKRDQAKTVGLAIIYGASGKRIGLYLGTNAQEGRRIVDKFFARSPRTRQLFDGIQLRLGERRYITNEFGRRRHLGLDEAYKGVNSLVQGWAGDLVKDAMVRIDRLGIVKTNTDTGFRMQVHDEVRLDGLTEKQEVDVEDALTAYNLLVPVTVSVKRSTTNWADAA